ncbi:hypothetical protein WR25_20728 [Diploscapter pachys]|uniref:G-protein coupled receptors family 1 profile domain-containing protein n=1 Tax=Diploscapter pachys TaxID=2018661 RepID=A0A2A2LS26_9BILA|nr:hypothetical protein WR25_20728 [Diploscapter pachys]
MELAIRYGGVENIPLYNCSEHTPEEWTRLHGEKHPIAGFLYLVYGIIIVMIYIPCLKVMASKELFRLSCFKIMFLLGLVDLCAITVGSIINGFLLIEGAVYCSHPILIYPSGSMALFGWCSACMICLILVINRILDILRPSMYTNMPHTINNFTIVFVTCFLYLFLCIALYLKVKKASTSTSHRSHKSIFIQSTIMCMINLIASIIYVLMQFIPVPGWLIIVAQMTWQGGHGAPAIVYITLNRTIRTGILQLLQVKNSASSSHITPTSKQINSRLANTSYTGETTDEKEY